MPRRLFIYRPVRVCRAGGAGGGVVAENCVRLLFSVSLSHTLSLFLPHSLSGCGFVSVLSSCTKIRTEDQDDSQVSQSVSQRVSQPNWSLWRTERPPLTTTPKNTTVPHATNTVFHGHHSARPPAPAGPQNPGLLRVGAKFPQKKQSMKICSTQPNKSRNFFKRNGEKSRKIGNWSG